MRALLFDIILLFGSALDPSMGFAHSTVRVPRTMPRLLMSTEGNISPSKWDKFDYLQHWYPVSWVCDLRANQPQKVTLFDVDYVVAVDSTTSPQKITALIDICPHKAAALSEGRMTAAGNIQCAYHGWSFDGCSGTTQEIPQASPTAASYPSRTCATPVGARVHQGMLWLWPGPVQSTYPSPPSIPEMDDPDFVKTRVVRDFPQVDWTLLVSNILDPDHGVFAHQMPAFDWYSASKEYPLTIKENFGDNGGWKMVSSVPAVDKLRARDNLSRGLTEKQKKKDDVKPPTLATSTFYAPTTISLSRRTDTPDSTTSFVSGFWVCPVGTGRSRFFSASCAKIPKYIKIPRWFFHLNLNSFLDQDTVLVASQQPAVLTAEAEGLGRCKSGLFSYASPTDRSVRLLDQFWDATAPKAPNRKTTLDQLYNMGLLRHTPDRRIILDREAQHLRICPDSQAAACNFRRIRNFSALYIASYLIGSIVQQKILQRGRVAVIVATLMASFAEKIRRSFYFCYPESKRDKDLRKIPAKMWLDKS